MGSPRAGSNPARSAFFFCCCFFSFQEIIIIIIHNNNNNNDSNNIAAVIKCSDISLYYNIICILDGSEYYCTRLHTLVGLLVQESPPRTLAPLHAHVDAGLGKGVVAVWRAGGATLHVHLPFNGTV